MANITTSNSTYAIGTIDTASTVINDTVAGDGTGTPIVASHINGVTSAIIQIETVLGSGVDLKGSATDLVERLAVSLHPTGKPKLAGGASVSAGSILYGDATAVFTQDNARLYWDASNYRLGILTNTPAQPLHVVGNARIDGDLLFTAGAAINVGPTDSQALHLVTATSSRLTVSPAGAITFDVVGPHAIGGSTTSTTQLAILGSFTGGDKALHVNTTLSPAANTSASLVHVAGSIVENTGGTHTDLTGLLVNPPTITDQGATTTNASTLKITGAPSVGSTLRALWVAGGLSDFDGPVQTDSTLTCNGAVTCQSTLQLNDSVSLAAGKTLTLSGTNQVVLSGSSSTLGPTVLQGHLTFNGDNTYDIGQSGATRPRHLYLSGNVGSGTWQGTAIAPTYGGTGLNTSASSGVVTINSGSWTINNVLTPNRILYAGGSNTITSSGSLTFDGTTFSTTGISASSNATIGGNLTVSGTTNSGGNIYRNSVLLMGASGVPYTALHTATGSVTGPVHAEVTVTMNDYSFFPSLSNSNGASGGQAHLRVPRIADPGNTVGTLNIEAVAGESSIVRWRYMTASYNPALYVNPDGVIWESDDPPTGSEPPIPGGVAVPFPTEPLASLSPTATLQVESGYEPANEDVETPQPKRRKYITYTLNEWLDHIRQDHPEIDQQPNRLERIKRAFAIRVAAQAEGLAPAAYLQKYYTYEGGRLVRKPT